MQQLLEKRMMDMERQSERTVYEVKLQEDKAKRRWEKAPQHV
jgi:hypothetical protein